MIWKVLWHPATRKDLRKIGRAGAKRVRDAVHSKLARDPFQGKMSRTSSSAPLRRFRAGKYRVVYAVKNDEILILILRVGHRSIVYRNLEEPPGGDPGS